jgi:hypothetical protein
MKGFIYLIEIAVAAILMTVVLTVFFSIRVKQDWERPDLVASGNNILNSMKNKDDFFLNILSENLEDIDKSKPENVKYGLRISGSPKSKISIGCYINCFYLTNMLNPALQYGSVFVNGRWINFTIDTFDINTGIQPYDVVVLINYTNYSHSAIKSRINEYLRNGGILIGINETQSNSDVDFNAVFNLSAGSGSSNIVNFTFYKPSENDIAKYFLGIGMDAYTNWRIWEEEWRIDYWSSNKINITKNSNPLDNRTNLAEGSIFNLTSPADGVKYFFKVKKMWYPERVDFQFLNKTFTFKDFSDTNKVRGKNIVGYSNFASITTNNSAIWISNFPQSDEYRALLKAAILSGVDEWDARGVYTKREKTTVSSFASLCCDMPETSELYLTLWYEI